MLQPLWLRTGANVEVPKTAISQMATRGCPQKHIDPHRQLRGLEINMFTAWFALLPTYLNCVKGRVEDSILMQFVLN